MSKKILAVALATVILAPPLLVEAQQQKVYRAGVLMIGSPDIPAMNGLRDGLKEARICRGEKPSPGHPRQGNHRRTPAHG